MAWSVQRWGQGERYSNPWDGFVESAAGKKKKGALVGNKKARHASTADGQSGFFFRFFPVAFFALPLGSFDFFSRALGTDSNQWSRFAGMLGARNLTPAAAPS